MVDIAPASFRPQLIETVPLLGAGTDRPARSIDRPGFVDTFAARFSGADGAGKRIADRAVRLISDAGDASDSDDSGDEGATGVTNPARLAVGIHHRLRGMGATLRAVVDNADRPGAPDRMRTNSDYAGTHLTRAQGAADRALGGLSPEADAATIRGRLETIDRETAAQETSFNQRIGRAYASEQDGAAAINLTLAPALDDPLPAPLSRAISGAAGWLASKLKDNVFTKAIAQAFTAIALIATWAAPIVLGALCIALPPLLPIAAPLAVASALAVPALTRFLNCFWIELNGDDDAPPTAVIQLTQTD